MRHTMKVIAVLALLAAAGCAEGGSTGEGLLNPGKEDPTETGQDPKNRPRPWTEEKLRKQPRPKPVPVDEPVQVPPESRRVELRVRGVNAPWAVEVALRSFEAQADGKSIPVTLTSAPLRLDSVDHAWRVGSLEVPEGVDRVHFVARFASAGALFEGESSRAIDLGGAPLVFSSKAEHLLSRHKLVIDLDVQRSLEEEELGATVLPHFNVRY